MISTLKTISSLFLLFIFLISPLFANAQNSISLSVSPTLFEMTANPAQEWDSSIRVINSNPQELEVYIDIVNFAPQGEVGQGVFIPVSEDESQGKTLAEWIKPQMTSVVIPPEKTVEIPFGIAVPEDAPPGGHFAAILIGTKPPKKKPEA